MKKVLLITQNFYPENFKSNDIAFDLVNRGYIVDALVGIPNYPYGTYFKGYGVLNKRIEIINGVNVYRVLQIPRGKNNKILLGLNYLSFVFFSTFWVLLFALIKKYDVIFVQGTSPVTQGIPGVLLKKICKTTLFFWVLDLWPESLRSAGGITNKKIISFFNSIVKFIYNNSDKILISSKSFKESILQKGDYSDKILYFPNWAEEVFVESQSFQVPTLPEGFKIMFAGNIGEAQDFESILNTAILTKFDENIKWIIIGDGRKKEWVTNFIKDNKLEKTVFLLGKYPIEYMPSFYKQADAMLVTLKDEEIFKFTVPAKTQSYMASGKPILAMVNGETSLLIQEACCGFAVNAGNSHQLARIIEDISQNKEKFSELGINGYNYFKKHFSKNQCIDKLCELIDN